MLANDQGTCPYEVIENFNHGLAAVSTSKTRLFWGCDYYAGCWGFIDESGEEVITPKYYAVEQYHAFADNYATVCKTGTDNEGKTIYRWGLIDISGNETVPCKYAHIIRLFNYTWEMNSGLFAAAIIRDKEWLWGIIDGQGKQVVPFIFEDDFWNQYTIKDNLLIYTSDTHSDGYNQESHGLYDIKTQTILIEPGIYRDMDFDDFGNIQAEDYKGITHILDSQTCKEIFPSEYSFFSASEKTGHYIVSCRKNGQRHEGLIDKTGTVIISPTKDITEILCNQNWIKFRKDGKVGVRDFDGNTVIPPLYDEIRSTYNPLIEICNKPNENKNLYGLAARNGICVLEPTYDSICWMADKKHFMLAKEHHYEMIEYREKKSV